MNGMMKAFCVAVLFTILVPSTALASKPDPWECPCRGYWNWAAAAFDCLNDVYLIQRGGWSSPPEVPISTSKFVMDGKKENLLALEMHLGVKEVDGDFLCSITGREALESDLYVDYEIYEPNPVTNEPLTLNEARGCVTATRMYFDALINGNAFCD
jgi:hypothetical protein